MATTPTDAGASFVQALYGALRSMRARGPAGSETRRAVEALRASCDPALKDGTLEVRLVRRALYLNGSRLSNEIENFVYYGHIVDALQGAGVGVLTFEGVPSRREVEIFLALVVRTDHPADGAARADRVRQGLAAQSVRGISVQPPAAGAADLPAEEARKDAAKKTYEESVAISRDLFNGTRMGRSANVRQVKQAVQNIVDGVLHHEASLEGLSTLKDYDEYAFTHAVNVCIFCVAIGKRLGLTKAQLFDLGHAALVHDVGMSRVPHDILIKGSALTEEEHARVKSHTWLGALSVFELRDFGEIPLRSMIVAYEHHLSDDGRGYPASIRPREPSVFSKIVSVASAFDAATNERSYSKARPADEVLREMWEEESLGFDPVIVKALINLLGIYPVGTCVILDTYELAIVHAANSDPAVLHRPVVRVLSNSDGVWLHPAPLADLADAKESGEFSRSIIKVTSPDKYGIQVSDYFE